MVLVNGWPRPPNLIIIPSWRFYIMLIRERGQDFIFAKVKWLSNTILCANYSNLHKVSKGFTIFSCPCSLIYMMQYLKIWYVNGTVFRGSGYSYVLSYGLIYLKTGSLENQTFFSGYKMVFNKMVPILLDFKWSDFQISGPMWNRDH